MATPFCSICTHLVLAVLCSSIFCYLPTSFSQPDQRSCNGIWISYHFNNSEQISPFLGPSDQANQPYSFDSTLTVRNNGRNELKNWRVFVEFNHSEFLVSATKAVLADGTSLPANVSIGAVFAGYPVTDLKTAIETAGDDSQMEANVDLKGTLFGLGPPGIPLPANISLANDGYLCPNPTNQGNFSFVCCMPDLNARTNITLINEDFSPLQSGDLTIMYDVLMTFEANYYAQVNISNDNPFARLDEWNLSWEWMEGEFISSMRGAYPKIVDTGDCIFGEPNNFYKEFDFSKVLTCAKRPTIVDLPLSRTNDTNLGLVSFCCKNGTILPPSMDPTKSKSSFQMQVYKMPPDINKTQLTPPQNWRINSTIGPGYQCGQPIRVEPTLFPDPSGLPSHTAAVASWQVVCNLTKTETKKSNCCVSFSAFYNESVIPCNTCACGCESNPTTPNNVCSATEPALLLPSQALLVPFDNRTQMAREFQQIHRRSIPNPLPCGDNCGVSINWHVLSDFKDGWTARITFFNWGDTNIVDWSAAVELDKAMPGFEQIYSVDGKPLPGSNNNTLFLQGFPGLNYLVAERNGSNPKRDPPVPGSQQSVISFKKKKTPGIKVSRGDGFPTKVYFNGEECSLPTILPSNACRIRSTSAIFSSMLSLIMVLIVLLQQY